MSEPTPGMPVFMPLDASGVYQPAPCSTVHSFHSNWVHPTPIAERRGTALEMSCMRVLSTDATNKKMVCRLCDYAGKDKVGFTAKPWAARAHLGFGTHEMQNKVATCSSISPEHDAVCAALRRREEAAGVAEALKKSDAAATQIVADHHQLAIDDASNANAAAGKTAIASRDLHPYVKALKSFMQMPSVKPEAVNLMLTSAMLRHGLPLHLVDSQAFRDTLTLAARCGASYLVHDDGKVTDCKAPHRTDMTSQYVTVVDAVVAEDMEECVMGGAAETGGIVISDGATDVCSNPYVNGIFVTPDGAIHLEATNCAGVTKDKQFIADIIIRLINQVGPRNVTGVCMDGACRSSFSLIEAAFPWVSCYICSTHSINNSIHDVFKEDLYKKISKPDNEGGTVEVFADTTKFTSSLKNCKKIVKFVTAHSKPLSVFRDLAQLLENAVEGGTEILKQAMCRFGSAVKMMARLYDVKGILAQTIVAPGYTDWVGKGSRDLKATAAEVKDLVGDEAFWADVDTCVRVMTPHYKAMRLSDGKRGSHLGKIYQYCLELDSNLSGQRGEIIGLSEEEREGVHNLWMARWAYFHTPLMSAAWAFDPEYLRVDLSDEASKKVMDDIDVVLAKLEQHPDAKEKKYTADRIKSEFLEMKHAIKLQQYSFTEAGAFSQVQQKRPGHLWYTQYAMRWQAAMWAGKRLTSCTASASLCETEWSHMEWIHSKKRNRLGQTVKAALMRAHSNLVMQEAWDRPLDALPWDVDMLIEEPEEEDDDDEMMDLTPVEAQTQVAAPVVAAPPAAPPMVVPVAQAQACQRPRRAGAGCLNDANLAAQVRDMINANRAAGRY